MARLTPAVVRPSQAGTTVTMGAVNSDGDAIPPNGAVLLTNGSGGSLTVTIVTPGTVGDNLAVADQTATVANGATVLLGPFREQHFIQPSGATKGLVHLNYSSQTSVTRQVIGVN